LHNFYSINRILKAWIQISRLYWFCLFSILAIRSVCLHQMMIYLTPIVSKLKNKWYKPQKSQEICIKFTITDRSIIDKWRSDAYFLPFLFYYCCTHLWNRFCKCNHHQSFVGCQHTYQDARDKRKWSGWNKQIQGMRPNKKTHFRLILCL